jgi:hypothetical protein
VYVAVPHEARKNVANIMFKNLESFITWRITSGACRRLGICCCVRPHDDTHKETTILFNHNASCGTTRSKMPQRFIKRSTPKPMIDSDKMLKKLVMPSLRQTDVACSL